MRFRPGRPLRRPGPVRWGPPLAGPRRALKAAALQTLGEAHRLLGAVRPAEAAALFEQLAEAAQTRGLQRQAAHLHLQAARSLAGTGNGRDALQHARTALGLFAAAGLAGQARAVYSRLLEEVRARGMQAEVEELEREFKASFGHGAPDLAPGASAEPAAKPRGRLPARCPNCGGPVRADEVEWIRPEPSSPADVLAQSELAAECAYCGSVLYLEE